MAGGGVRNLFGMGVSIAGLADTGKRESVREGFFIGAPGREYSGAFRMGGRFFAERGRTGADCSLLRRNTGEMA